ncbi:MAG: aminotransferase class I/II-fold pyridoxal phosphate-dependent enzyme, partial [Planctomycetota bacterium]
MCRMKAVRRRELRRLGTVRTPLVRMQRNYIIAARVHDPIAGFSNTTIQIGECRYLNYSGCDYLGFAGDRDVTNAARRAILQFGVSARASRVVTGTLTIHLELEREIASFLNVEDAVTVPAGWMAGSLAAHAVARNCDRVFIYMNAHASLHAAARAAGLPVIIVKSTDPVEWKRAVARAKSKAPLTLSDSVSLPDCTFHPLRELLEIAGARKGYFIVDDAHGVGIVGKSGRGAAELLNLAGSRFVITGSLSKAFGSQGGFVAGARDICNEARMTTLYAGATPLSPPVAAAAAHAIHLSSGARGRELRYQLKMNTAFVARELTKRNITFVSNPEIPWLAFHGNGARPEALSDHLYHKGIVAPLVQYAGGPAGGYVRASVNARHTKKQLQQFVAALADGWRTLSFLLIAAFMLTSCAGGPPRTIITDLAAAREALVDVRSADPSILVELRYNQSDNFMKRNVYHSDRAF